MRAAAVVLVLGAASSPAHADVRAFTHTYEYSTVPEGRTTFEIWHTQGRTTWDTASPQFFEHILEIEHGITEHWDMGFQTIGSQVAGDATTEKGFTMDAVRLESRYRFADRGEWPVDTQLQLAVAKQFGASIYAIEGRVVVARDFDKLTAAANASIAVAFGNDQDDTLVTTGWAGGVTYTAHPKVRIGAETWGARVVEGGLDVSAGPAVNLSPASNFWLTITGGFGITDEADAFAARAIVGIEL
ncbi:MAG: hypothetical protein H0T46_01320 [Deltaproteobacteria bacterium]|nr:hypothetical protein [Deltaproteobacteria bacterium]